MVEAEAWYSRGGGGTYPDYSQSIPLADGGILAWQRCLRFGYLRYGNSLFLLLFCVLSCAKYLVSMQISPPPPPTLFSYAF